MKAAVLDLVDWLVPAERFDDPRKRRTGRLIVGFVVLGLPFFVYYGLRDALLGNSTWAAVILVSAALFGATPLLLRFTGRTGLTGNTLAGILFLQIMGQVLVGGGFQTEFLLWTTVIPTGAIALGWRLSGLVWTGVLVVSFVVVYGLQVTGILTPTRELGPGAALSNLIGFVLLMGLLLYVSDVTRARLRRENEALARQLERSHRLESVAQVAAGVTHEFNNLLTVIEGNSGLLLDALEPDSELREDIEEIRAAARRGAAFTSQLLAFAGQQAARPAPIDPGQALEHLQPLLQRLLGEHVETILEIDPDLPAIEVDQRQLQRVLVNAVLNARDALPDGGRVELGASVVQLDPERALALALQPGVWVRYHVRDDGLGIRAEELDRIFEPFFTTKPRSESAGLGLSTAYGLVRRAGGTLGVESELGAGTTLSIYLPPSQSLAPRSAPTPIPENVRGRQTILVVDDQAMVSRSARRLLERWGYRVREATSGAEARAIFERERGGIDLLLTDVVMPDLSGPELASELLKERPSLAVLYMTGYPEHVIEDGSERIYVLEKPFGPEELRKSVRRVLRGGADSGDAPEV